MSIRRLAGLTAGTSRRAPLASASFVAAMLSLSPALAQDESPAAEGSLSIELNALQSTQNGCLFTFVAENGLDTAIDRAAYEVVIFNGQGLVQRMTVLDFQALPEARTRVRQFNIAEADCANISRVLINDVSACDGEGLEPSLCMDRLETASQSDVRFSH